MTEEREKELEEYKKKVDELSKQFGFNVRPIITKYGPQLEIVDMGKTDIGESKIIVPK